MIIDVFIDPGFKVDALEDTSVTIAPSAPSGYNCTPPIPQGELNTSGTLMIYSGLDASSEGEYRCVSNDVNGTIVIDLNVFGKLSNSNMIHQSRCVQLEVCIQILLIYVFNVALAYISSSSGDVTAIADSNIILDITASGIPEDITYEWKKNGVIIPGETSSTLTLSDVSVDDIGQYECIPSNSVGSHNSSIIQVDVKSESYCVISPRKCFPIFLLQSLVLK